MIESPMLDELREGWTAEARVRDIFLILRERFGAIDEDCERALRTIRADKVEETMLAALRIASLAEFEEWLKRV